MGMRMPETCWAVFKWQVINLRNCCIWLVDLFEWIIVHCLVLFKILLLLLLLYKRSFGRGRNCLQLSYRRHCSLCIQASLVNSWHTYTVYAWLLLPRKLRFLSRNVKYSDASCLSLYLFILRCKEMSIFFGVSAMMFHGSYVCRYTFVFRRIVVWKISWLCGYCKILTNFTLFCATCMFI